MRNSSALVLVIIGALLCFPASVALWEQRTLAREDAFVALGRDVLEKDAVQVAIARAIAGQVDDYPAGSGARSGSKTVSVENITREAVEEAVHSDVATTALRGTYKVTRLLANLDSDTVQVSGEDLVIDLKPTVLKVAQQMNDGEPLETQMQLSPEDGRIVIADGRDVGLVLDGWRVVNRSARLITLLPLAAFALALVVASSRSFMLFLIGASVTAGAAIRIFLLEGPVDSSVQKLIASGHVYSEAGAAVYEAIAGSFVSQDVLVLLAGVTLAGAGLASSLVLAHRRVSAACRKHPEGERHDFRERLVC